MQRQPIAPAHLLFNRVYLQACKSTRKSTPYTIHSISTLLHYNKSKYSHYKNSHYKRSTSSRYKINIIGDPFLHIKHFHDKRSISYCEKFLLHNSEITDNSPRASVVDFASITSSGL